MGLLYILMGAPRLIRGRAARSWAYLAVKASARPPQAPRGVATQDMAILPLLLGRFRASRTTHTLRRGKVLHSQLHSRQELVSALVVAEVQEVQM